MGMYHHALPKTTPQDGEAFSCQVLLHRAFPMDRKETKGARD